MANSIKSESAFFYGFAENKQTEISHNEDVLVSDINVKTGQAVRKGDLLLTVIDEDIKYKMGEIANQKESIEASSQTKIIEINGNIQRIELTWNSEIIELESDIKELENEIALNESLYEGLKTIKSSDAKYISPDEVKLDYLQNRLTDTRKTKQSEIDQQKKMLAQIMRPSRIKSEALDSELEFMKMKEGKLSIYAPFDGLVGTISCKEGENITAYSSLLDLYNHNPSQVKGYVHESMILEVAVGDKLEVASTLHPDIKVVGEVIGMGSRIVEIPERLRKMADFKTYGREVIIEIPSENSFLQKEKVMLNVYKSKGQNGSLGSLFSSGNSAPNTLVKESKSEK